MEAFSKFRLLILTVRKIIVLQSPAKETFQLEHLNVDLILRLESRKGKWVHAFLFVMSLPLWQ